MDAPFRAYIKDCLHLNEKPKYFLTVLSGSPSGDILTSSSSSFECLEEIPDEIQEGDIFVLYGPSGNACYTGVIKAKEDRQIQTEQIYALFDQDWFIHIDKRNYLEEEIAAIFSDFIAGKLGEIVTSLPEPNITTYEANRNYFVYDASGSTPVYKEYRVNVYEEKIDEEHSDETQTVYKMDEVGELAAADISQITDPLHTTKYGAFTVTYENSQQVHLTTPENLGEFRNLEEFIYTLYDQYGIVVEITVPYESGCNINIKTANYTGTKISKNTSIVLEIDPKTETQELNKLVIFGSSGNFRKTYYATTEGVVTDGSDANRLHVLNTSYVYSDDGLDDIKAENLKDEMYNHEIRFELLLSNKLYDFYNWHFGQPLEVYYKDKVYNSIYTGYSYSFDNGETPASVEITCGIVRTKLTDKLNMEKKEVSASTGLSISSSGGGSSSGGVSRDYVDNALATKVDKVTGMGLSSNDYTSAEKTKLANLATVASTGSYSDLSGTPTIPTVNNGTLTIQKNGSNVATFTANQSGTSTANITVPTKVSELTNDSGFTANTGTITGITMNGASKGTSGVVDLGTVLTAHQDISGKQDKITAITPITTQGVYPIKVDSQGHIVAYGEKAIIPEFGVPVYEDGVLVIDDGSYATGEDGYVHKSGTQTYNVAGTTFTVGSVSFMIEEVSE